MNIGHVCLEKDFGSAAQQLVLLVDALGNHDVRQHVIVRCPSLAECLATYDNVTVGPIVGSAVTAYCLLPPIGIAHIHEPKGVPAGLLLTLTRSIPFIITHRNASLPPYRAITQSAYNRAASIVCVTAESEAMLRRSFPETLVDTIRDSGIDSKTDKQKMAAKYLHIYRRSLDDRGIPAILI